MADESNSQDHIIPSTLTEIALLLLFGFMLTAAFFAMKSAQVTAGPGKTTPGKQPQIVDFQGDHCAETIRVKTNGKKTRLDIFYVKNGPGDQIISRVNDKFIYEMDDINSVFSKESTKVRQIFASYFNETTVDPAKLIEDIRTISSTNPKGKSCKFNITYAVLPKDKVNAIMDSKITNPVEGDAPTPKRGRGSIPTNYVTP